MDINPREIKTSAKRKLVPEHIILQVKHRVELGVPLNAAVKIIMDNMSNVAAIKLIRWHDEMEQALAQEDFTLYESIKESLFPEWVGEEQPDEACYHGQFPYGYWEQ